MRMFLTVSLLQIILTSNAFALDPHKEAEKWGFYKNTLPVQVSITNATVDNSVDNSKDKTEVVKEVVKLDNFNTKTYQGGHANLKKGVGLSADSSLGSCSAYELINEDVVVFSVKHKYIERPVSRIISVAEVYEKPQIFKLAIESVTCEFQAEWP